MLGPRASFRQHCVVRPIRPDGGPQLAEALRRLSPEARQRRFLYSKGSFSLTELEYFTHCDGVNHLAWVLAVTDPEGQELQPVAVALGVSVKTVDAHRANVMHKLDLHSVTDLVRYAVRNQIIEA
jgi:hypothetical protein